MIFMKRENINITATFSLLSFAQSTTLQVTAEAASSSGASAPAISGKAVKRAFGVTDYDYCGNVEYTNDKAVLYHSEGYVTFDKNQQPEFHYYLKDHLGNVRGVTDYSEILETFQSTGNVTATRNVWNKETSAEQHNDVIKAGGGILRGTYNYKRTSSELIKRFPNLKSIFDIMHKEYEKRYK